MKKTRQTQDSKIHSFNTIMNHTRVEMNNSEKMFSKVIHIRAIELIDEIVSRTILRPSGAIGAGTLCLIGSILLTRHTRSINLQMPGLETLLLLVLGYTLGIIVEWLIKSMFIIFKKA